MRKTTSARWIALLSLGAMLMLVSPAVLAIPGPDPVDSEPAFQVFVAENPGAPLPLDLYDEMNFEESLGWDFGDRYSYNCAWVEFFQAGNERFEIHFEMVQGYPYPLEINDRYGLEDETADTTDDTPLCGNGFGRSADEPFDGSDHFPHLIHAGDGLTFFSGGTQFAYLDLTNPTCDKAYWVAGNEPGEAWLWWDEDGPTGSHEEGVNDLPCGGGPGEPIPVVRAHVMNADPDVGYCTHSMHEDQCFNVATSGPVVLPDGNTTLVCDDGSKPAVISKRTDPDLIVRC